MSNPVFLDKGEPLTKINGAMLKLAREGRGLAKFELAKKAKLKTKQISWFEQYGSIKKETLEQLATILDFPVAFFYREPSEPPVLNTRSFHCNLGFEDHPY